MSTRIIDREVRRAGLDKSCRRFTTLAALDGFEVVDLDGRPVDHRPTLRSAAATATALNAAHRAGPRALVGALIQQPTRP